MPKKLIKSINQYDNFIIFPHYKPDGDALGSILAMGYLLKKLGKNPYIFLENIPEQLVWLRDKHIKNFNVVSEKEISNFEANNIEAIVFLDFQIIKRLNPNAQQWFEKSKNSKKVFCIDHHIGNPTDFDYTYINTQMSSTCEWIHTLISQSENDKLFDKQIGECLYTGIVTDTNSFKFSTTSNTLRKAAEIMDLGVDSVTIQQNIYDKNSLVRLNLMSLIVQNMEIFSPQKISLTFLSQNDLKKSKEGDTDGLVNLPLSLEEVDCSITLYDFESRNHVKISFRSQGDIDVNTMAREWFNGGGHFHAAGALTTKMNLQECITYVKQKVSQWKLN